MKIDKIFNVVKTFIFKNSPYILSGVGAASVATGAVFLVKKAKKQNEFDEEVEIIYEERKQGIEVYGAANEIPVDRREKVYRKGIVKLNIWKAGKYTKYYAAPVILISGGIMCMISALLIQTKRLKALSVAYTTLASVFGDYRERVRNKIGDKEEQQLFEGIERNKNGAPINDLKSDKSKLYNEESFSRLFGEGNSVYWTKNTRLCLTVINAAQTNLNSLLRYQGFVTLNDVWKELGFKPSSQGMYLGWRYKYGDPVFGSTYIDLGYSGPKNDEKCEYLKNCWNEELWIDVVPPHVLFDVLPKEISRTDEQKNKIIENRKRIITTSGSEEKLFDEDYDAQINASNKIRNWIKKYR